MSEGEPFGNQNLGVAMKSDGRPIFARSVPTIMVDEIERDRVEEVLIGAYSDFWAAQAAVRKFYVILGKKLGEVETEKHGDRTVGLVVAISRCSNPFIVKLSRCSWPEVESGVALICRRRAGDDVGRSVVIAHEPALLRLCPAEDLTASQDARSVLYIGKMVGEARPPFDVQLAALLGPRVDVLPNAIGPRLHSEASSVARGVNRSGG